MGLLTLDRLIEAGDLLRDVGDALESLQLTGELAVQSCQASVSLKLTRNYLAELATHLAKGAGLDEALIATVRGELMLSPEESRNIKELQRQMADPTRHN